MIEKIRAEIERLKERANAERVLHPNTILSAKDFLLIKDYDSLLSFLDNLKEEPVDLEKEIDKEWKKCNPVDEGMGVEMAWIHIEQFDCIARHFYELGRNAK